MFSLSRGGLSGPGYGVGTNRLIETFERNFAKVLERQCFSFAQLGDHVRNQNLLRLRMRTKSGRQLDRAAKKIVVVLNRFAGGNTGPNLK